MVNSGSIYLNFINAMSYINRYMNSAMKIHLKINLRKLRHRIKKQDILSNTRGTINIFDR